MPTTTTIDTAYVLCDVNVWGPLGERRMEGSASMSNEHVSVAHMYCSVCACASSVSIRLAIRCSLCQWIQWTPNTQLPAHTHTRHSMLTSLCFLVATNFTFSIPFSLRTNAKWLHSQKQKVCWVCCFHRLNGERSMQCQRPHAQWQWWRQGGHV